MARESRFEAEWAALVNEQTAHRAADAFSSYVLATCSPSHVQSGRLGVNWMPVPGVPGRFLSVPGNLVHDCRPGLKCDSWICRFKDGARICAISGRFLAQDGDVSPRKRVIERALEAQSDGEDAKRHQDRAVENSTAALWARGDQAMDVEPMLMSSPPPVSLRSYNPRPHDSAPMHVESRSWATSFDAA